MTERVDFYVLGSAGERQRWAFACRLAEKIYLRNLRAVILTGSEEDARALDALLWTFSDGSFVPHALCAEGGGTDAATPVHLTADAAGAPPADVLVNLSDALPPAADRYARIAEIVDGDPARRARARERFKAYREMRIAVESHQRGPGRDATEPEAADD